MISTPPNSSRRHAADEFVFDSVRRQFVLKSELAGGQLASATP